MFKMWYTDPESPEAPQSFEDATANLFAIEKKDLITQVARIIGFKTTRGNTFDRVDTVIKKILTDGDLVKKPNGMINFTT